MITVGKELCPYFGEEQREEWHRKRGLDDPQKAKELEVLPKEFIIPQEKLVLEPKEAFRKPADLGDKHARYRARKKEELAAKARARRAKKA